MAYVADYKALLPLTDVEDREQIRECVRHTVEMLRGERDNYSQRRMCTQLAVLDLAWRRGGHQYDS